MIDRRTTDEIARDDNADARAGRFRAMDTSLGRWTRTDPLGYVDGLNGYEGNKSNPMVFLDQYGLQVVYVGPDPLGVS